jgi:S-adenosyl methyltransferase
VPDSGTSVPHIAGIYDYWLGGKDNFAADREAAERAMAARCETVEGLKPADFLHPPDVQLQVSTLRAHRV